MFFLIMLFRTKLRRASDTYYKNWQKLFPKSHEKHFQRLTCVLTNVRRWNKSKNYLFVFSFFLWKSHNHTKLVINGKQLWLYVHVMPSHISSATDWTAGRILIKSVFFSWKNARKASYVWHVIMWLVCLFSFIISTYRNGAKKCSVVSFKIDS